MIWVDDLIISASDSNLLSNVKNRLNEKFKMKDLGALSWFLGTEFKGTKGSIEMNQSLHIEKLLNRFGMINCKSKSTPSILGSEKVTSLKSEVLEECIHADRRQPDIYHDRY